MLDSRDLAYFCFHFAAWLNLISEKVIMYFTANSLNATLDHLLLLLVNLGKLTMCMFVANQ